MKRRDALKGMVAGAALASATAPNAFGATPRGTGTDVWDVIVLGGGFAGVTAARDSSQHGLSTLLLEARDRLGGRTWNEMFDGQKIETGGTWIGWSQPHVWSEVMRYDLPIIETRSTAPDTRWIWSDGASLQSGPVDDYWKVMSPAYDAFYAPARDVLPRPYTPLFVADAARYDQISAAEAIDKLPLSQMQKVLMKSFTAIDGHNYSRASSYLDQMRWIALSGFDKNFMWDNIGRYRFADGTESLIGAIIKDSKVEVRLKNPVVKVTQTVGGAEVLGADGKIHRAKTVIVALPLNLLSKVQFEPGLSPEKLSASLKRHTGRGTKVWLSVPHQKAPIFANGPEDWPLNFVWTEMTGPDRDLLVGFGLAPELLDTTDKVAVQAAVRRYVPNIEVLDVHSHNWTEDEYSLGTWCMYPPGLLTSSLPALQKPEGHLLFATSDVASGWRGFIDGAIERGAIAAQAAVKKVRGA